MQTEIINDLPAVEPLNLQEWPPLVKSAYVTSLAVCLPLTKHVSDGTLTKITTDIGEYLIWSENKLEGSIVIAEFTGTRFMFTPIALSYDKMLQIGLARLALSQLQNLGEDVCG